MLETHRHDLIVVAARGLDKAQMIRFCERTGTLSATDLGRTASHYYIKYNTVEVSAFGWSQFLPSFCSGFCTVEVSQ